MRREEKGKREGDVPADCSLAAISSCDVEAFVMKLL